MAAGGFFHGLIQSPANVFLAAQEALAAVRTMQLVSRCKQ
jgi:hypothetical protein